MRVAYRCSFLFVLLAGCVSVGLAQHVSYPLHNGDFWNYTDLHGHPEYLQRVVGDTIMPDGFSYAIVYSTHFIRTEYLRQSGDSVLGYEPDSMRSYLKYDFDRSPGDTISTRLVNHMTVDCFMIAKGIDSIFGRKFRSWEFYTHPRNTFDADEDIWIRDTVGVVYYGAGLGIAGTLWGAIIDGVTYGTITSVHKPQSTTPHDFVLHQNYPNPFNPTTQISYTLPHASPVRLSLYDMLGREVRVLVDQRQDAGEKTVMLNAEGLASGVYYYRLVAGGFVQTRKTVVMR